MKNIKNINKYRKIYKIQMKFKQINLKINNNTVNSLKKN